MAKRGRPKLSKFHKAGFSGPVRPKGRPKKFVAVEGALYGYSGGKKRGRPKGSKSKTNGKKTVRATIIFD